MWLLGLPIGLAMGFEGGVFSAAAYLMGLISADAVAAHAVALQIAALSFMVPWGMAQAATVRVGLALGRGDRAGIARAGWTAWGIGRRLHGADGAGHLAHPAPADDPVPRGYAANAKVIALGVSFLGVAAIFQIVDGAQVVGAGILRGLHDTRVPMIFTFIGYWVIGIGVGVWLAFSAGWGGVGIWTGLALGLAIVAVLMLCRWVAARTLGPACAQAAMITAAQCRAGRQQRLRAHGNGSTGRRTQPCAGGIARARRRPCKRRRPFGRARMHERHRRIALSHRRNAGFVLSSASDSTGHGDLVQQSSSAPAIGRQAT